MFGALKPFAFFLGGSASVLVLATVIGTAHPTFVALLCLVILLAGLPHGAFDYHIMSARYEGSALAFALAVYVGLAGITVLLWWLMPLWFLSSFLAYSAYHFGDSDWPDQGTKRKWSWGLSIVGLPCLLAPQSVEPMFAVIAGIAEIALLT
jgi:Brp/Blh family beta-carotene 15,15'-monooxygenase